MQLERQRCSVPCFSHLLRVARQARAARSGSTEACDSRSSSVGPSVCRVWRDMGSAEWQQTLVAESDRYEDLGQW